MLARLRLISYTLLYLRWEQIVYRPLRLFQYFLYRNFPLFSRYWLNSHTPIASPSAATLLSFRQCFEDHFFHLQVCMPEAASGIQALIRGEFSFLNHQATITNPDWNKRYVSHLWSYQLHYQDYVLVLMQAWSKNSDVKAKEQACKLIDTWVETARIGVSDGWDAYPISLRVVNWMYAYAIAEKYGLDELFLTRWRTSIFQQLYFLNAHLENHLLANHLLKNIKALVIGGLFFSHTEQGQQWLSKGVRKLESEFREQVLPDGGHYERTPMYHVQALSDFLECYDLLQVSGHLERTSETRTRLLKMGEYLTAMSYPDGSLALFNDSGNMSASSLERLLAAVSKVCEKSISSAEVNFPNSGYYVWQSSDQLEKIIVDAGEPSVSYNTAHAHCDMLSFELRLYGTPLVVDSGVHGYEGDKYREYCRSTRAHNTVMVDDKEQSEIWSTFRVARRARVVFAASKGDVQTWNFTGEIHGYGKNGLCHQRSISRLPNGEWTVTDYLSLRRYSNNEHVAKSFIHLHPIVQVRQEENRFVCETQGRTIVIEPFGNLTFELVKGAPPPAAQGWWFPEFGKALPNSVIIMRYVFRKDSDEQVIGYRIKPYL